jgi:hypothetical protein
VVRGGRKAFIGVVHRMAMRLDDLIELLGLSRHGGAGGVAFIEAAVKSSRKNGVWASVGLS